MKVIGYTRSHASDDENVEPRAAQEKRVSGYADSQGWPSVAKWIHDDEPLSSRLLDRAGAPGILDLAEPGDVVLCPRLADVQIFPIGLCQATGFLEEREAELVFCDIGNVTRNPTVRTLVDALSLSDPMNIVATGRWPFAEGYRGGVLPFGMRRDEQGHLVADADLPDKVQLILDLHGEGKSLRAISQELAKQGVELSHVGVSRVLKRYAAPFQ